MFVPILAIDQASATLCAGGVIAYPTEGVWGLGADPFDRRAVARVTTLKRRPPERGYIVVAADESQLDWCLYRVPRSIRAEMRARWPGPVTWVVPATPETPEWITGRFDSIAVRVSAHPIVAALCNAFDGPIVSTSANPHGAPPARSALKVRQYFRDRIDRLVPGPLGGRSSPTEIRDAITGQVIRPAR